MTHRRVPEDIFRMFDGDEEAKAKGRRAAIDWIQTQTWKVGDTLIIPNPDDGTEMVVMKKHNAEV